MIQTTIDKIFTQPLKLECKLGGVGFGWWKCLFPSYEGKVMILVLKYLLIDK